ncbi:hypothetical protein AJ80_01511 [Polytolypa hystricis UAMH7299]|uniref:CobW/HypB/UreG nucleotide-binding domain-containing protein n=1 Tax=Polytolypa hystricis (strain UAMH7299) TaxID=1447883 RepID=A0A2B7Z1N9_POLH7|nr:hypothetical protein AJ80_01511 [Polytolypa hystricis UAMH7299]
MAPIPITIVTGFLGSGKTTILLNLIPQLPKDYRLALLKNEFGDVAVDSQLAAANAISGVRELLNGCICCNLVGQLDEAILELRDTVKPDRIVVETSGSAFPATLAMAVNRLISEHPGEFELDGVITVIDVENWQGYEDTSYTAKLQARYTDLVIFNKWESASEERFDVCLDRLGDLEEETPWVKSEMGKVTKDVLLGLDNALFSRAIQNNEHRLLDGEKNGSTTNHSHDHSHKDDHQSEVEVLSVTVTSTDRFAILDSDFFATSLRISPKEEVYRIKGIVRFPTQKLPVDSSDVVAPSPPPVPLEEFLSDDKTPAAPVTQAYILNFAFNRWTFTLCPPSAAPDVADENGNYAIARLTFVLARDMSAKWKKKIEEGKWLTFTSSGRADTKLRVEKIG